MGLLIYLPHSAVYVAEFTKASRGFEPRSLDSESRVLTVTPRGQLVSKYVKTSVSAVIFRKAWCCSGALNISCTARCCRVFLGGFESGLLHSKLVSFRFHHPPRNPPFSCHLRHLTPPAKIDICPQAQRIFICLCEYSFISWNCPWAT